MITSNLALIAAVSIFAGVGVLMLGLLVFLQDRSRIANRYFVAFTLTICVWGIVTGLFVLAAEQFWIEVLAAITFVSGATIPLIGLFYAMAETQTISSVPVWVRVLILIPYFGLALPLSILHPSLVTIGSDVSGLWHPVLFGPYFAIYAVYIGAYGIVTGYIFYDKYKVSAGIFKTHLRAVVTAIVGSTLIAVSTNMLFPWLFDISYLIWIGPLAMLVGISIIGYHMARYNQWNMRLLWSSTLVAGIVLTILIQTLFSDSTADIVVNMTVFALVSVSGFVLIHSVVAEAKIQEKVSRLASELGDKNERLLQLDVRKSQFVMVAAHHLRDPITAVKGYASMMLEGSFGTLNNSEAREAIKKIYQSSQRLVGIVTDFMDISNIEHGEMQYVMQVIELDRIVSDIVDELQNQIKLSGLDFEYIVQPGVSYTIRGDRGKLHQVISNLLDNALKYTSEGGMKIELEREESTDTVHLSIQDTGIGMTQSTIDKLFRKFSRADGVAKMYTDGSGLGLYVARQILLHHEASISAESKGPGKGSTFHIRFQALTDGAETYSLR